MTNELIRRREEQEQARLEFERQAELRSRTIDEWVPAIDGCDREWLLEMSVAW